MSTKLDAWRTANLRGKAAEALRRKPRRGIDDFSAYTDRGLVVTLAFYDHLIERSEAGGLSDRVVRQFRRTRDLIDAEIVGRA